MAKSPIYHGIELNIWCVVIQSSKSKSPILSQSTNKHTREHLCVLFRVSSTSYCTHLKKRKVSFLYLFYHFISALEKKLNQFFK